MKSCCQNDRINEDLWCWWQNQLHCNEIPGQLSCVFRNISNFTHNRAQEVSWPIFRCISTSTTYPRESVSWLLKLSDFHCIANIFLAVVWLQVCNSGSHLVDAYKSVSSQKYCLKSKDDLALATPTQTLSTLPLYCRPTHSTSLMKNVSTDLYFWYLFVSSEGALYVILPYDYQATFWTHTGP